MKSLKEFGYSTCFFVGGGNSMFLLEAASRYFTCIPVIHEVSAAIGAEYFNQTSKDNSRAFALVTAGPGLTNLVTGIAGAWLDSRELLVVGGQSKTTHLAKNSVRQIGHQEVNGYRIVNPITKKSYRIVKPLKKRKLYKIISQTWSHRPGPVFVEVCLDVSAKETFIEKDGEVFCEKKPRQKKLSNYKALRVKSQIKKSHRPLLLLGGGVTIEDGIKIQEVAKQFSLPIACTWTGADRVNSDYEYYAGRPNTYGMRWSNIFLQQSDLVIAVGTSLGYQQTGFNVKNFAPLAKIIHVDIDKGELKKLNPRKRLRIQMDSSLFLDELSKYLLIQSKNYREWANFLRFIQIKIPKVEDCQKSKGDFLSPHEVIESVTDCLGENDVIVAGSSGGTFTATMQVLQLSKKQRLLCNKGLASMGYGLAGAIGAAIGSKKRVVLFEGDGGFAQNLQELGTVKAQKLNIKIFITSNDGYASIRTSQQNYFKGHYIGCDESTGLFLPNWIQIAAAFSIRYLKLDKNFLEDKDFIELWNSDAPALFIVAADPTQIYLPKILSEADKNGNIESTPLHIMYPDLGTELNNKVFKYISWKSKDK
jgi:acetolactate synthase-1/2/3 large subunit